jgi:hypothetical protein
MARIGTCHSYGRDRRRRPRRLRRHQLLFRFHSLQISVQPRRRLLKSVEVLGVFIAYGHDSRQALLKIEKVDNWISHRLAVEGVRVCGIEIDQPSNLVRVAASDGTQLCAAQRMSYQNGMIDLETLHHSEDIIPVTIA